MSSLFPGFYYAPDDIDDEFSPTGLELDLTDYVKMEVEAQDE